MVKLEFPVFKTKSPPGSPRFNLNDPKERAKYFQFKAGPQIKKIRKLLESQTFLTIWLGKKQAGKGTYTKMFFETMDQNRVAHISVGDLVRTVHRKLETDRGRKEIKAYLKKDYRGYISIEEGIEAILNRSTEKVSVPDELMLSLIKREIDQQQGKAIFLDGFPRTPDQISYSLYIRDLAGYRNDPDFFALIDIPLKVIDARMRNRVICPVCSRPFHTKFYPSSKIEYDQGPKKYYILCDNPECRGARTKAKEGDELGVKAIKERLEVDEELIRKAFKLHGIPKILLRNTIPLKDADELVDDYELTQTFSFDWNQKKNKVEIKGKTWVTKDDQGRESVVLPAPPVVVALIHQLADLL